VDSAVADVDAAVVASGGLIPFLSPISIV